MDRKPIKWLGVILAVGALIAVICMCSSLGGLGGLFGGDRDLPSTGSERGDLGRMYTASQVDSSGCPIQRTTRFSSGEPIFVGLEESSIPAGATIFVRLYYENQAIEDAPPIQADRDMQTCVWFTFEPSGAQSFQPGNYEAELLVNGNSADRVSFQIENTGAQGNVMPETGPLAGAERVELGNVFASSAVDQTGCPLDSVSEFYSDESIYISYEESFIPAGTEMFARLVYNGRAIEDTEPIFANADMETCVWFVFEPAATSSALQPGEYQAEVYIDGNLADTVPFSVR